MAAPSQDQISRLWAFARGDDEPKDFESWFLEQATLRELLGEHLHWEVTSGDYRDKDVVRNLRRQVRTVLEQWKRCECPGLNDLAVVPMGGDGLDERVFSTVDRVKDHGGKQWWLYLSRCTACGQDWMVAQEERIYDDYLLKRLTPEDASAIVEHGTWPPDFLTFECVLRLERQLSTPPRWFDINESPLALSITEMCDENPELSREDAAHIAGIDWSELARLRF